MYRRRLLAGLVPYSKDPDVQKFDFTATQGPGVIPNWAVAKYADQIKADALDPASYKADTPAGTIKEIVKKDLSGRNRHEFISSDQKTTFISEMTEAKRRGWTATVGNKFIRLLDYMNGVTATTPRNMSVKPVNAGRMALKNGFPRT